MRDFNPIVGVARGVVNHGRHGDTMRGTVAAEAIGDKAAWSMAMCLQQFAKESRWEQVAGSRMTLSGIR